MKNIKLADWLSVLKIGTRISILGLTSRYKIEIDDDMFSMRKQGMDVDYFLENDKFAELYDKEIDYVYVDDDVVKISLVK